MLLALLFSMAAAVSVVLTEQLDCRPTMVMFVDDRSKTVTRSEFQKSKKFTNAVVDSVYQRNNKTIFGATTFATLVTENIPLANFRAGGFNTRFNAVPYVYGRTALGDAIGEAGKSMIRYLDGHNVTNYMIVMSDGRSNRGSNPTVSAQNAKNAGLELHVVQTGVQVDSTVLDVIASKPTQQHRYAQDSQEDVTRLSNLIVEQNCQKKPPCEDTPVDLFFVVDTSGSMSKHDLMQQNEFIINVASAMYPSQTVRLGVILFGIYVRLGIPLKKYTRDDFVTKVENMGRVYGRTATGVAMKMAADEFKKHATPGSVRKALILANGDCNFDMGTGIKTKQGRQALWDAKAESIAIGVGDDVKQAELEEMSTHGVMHKVGSREALDDIVNGLVQNLCNPAKLSFAGKPGGGDLVATTKPAPETTAPQMMA